MQLAYYARCDVWKVKMPPKRKPPGGNFPAECNNIFKATIWKLALTHTPLPIRPTRWCPEPTYRAASGIFSRGNIRGVALGEYA